MPVARPCGPCGRERADGYEDDDGPPWGGPSGAMPQEQTGPYVTVSVPFMPATA